MRSKPNVRVPWSYMVRHLGLCHILLSSIAQREALYEKVAGTDRSNRQAANIFNCFVDTFYQAEALLEGDLLYHRPWRDLEACLGPPRQLRGARDRQVGR